MDISIKETGSGGDFILKGNDLEKSDSIYNQIYLALFGGNIEASTPVGEYEEEFKYDYWGNKLLFENESDKQFNSTTENFLNEITLSSANRVLLEQVVKGDLGFLNQLGQISVVVNIPNVDKVEIIVLITEPENEIDLEYRFMWEATKNEIIINSVI